MTARSLGEVARFVNGFPFKPSDWGREGFPIIRIQNLTGTNDDFNYTTREVKSELIIEPGDLLVSWSATLDVYRWGGPRGLLNQHIFKVFPYSGIDPDYLYFALKNVIGELSHKTHGSTMTHVMRGDFESTKVLVPPLAEQRRIVDIVSRAEGVIRLQRHAAEKAREIIPALFIDMFGDPATNSKNWDITHLGGLIDKGPQNGLYKPASEYGEGYPILRIDGFYDGHVTDLNSLRRVRLTDGEAAHYALKEGSIVVNRVNSPDYLGKSAIVPPLNELTVFESNMMQLSVRQDVLDPRFLIQLLQTPYIRRVMLSRAKQAINQSSINQTDVKSLPVILPPLHVQQAFAERVNDIHSILAQRDVSQRSGDALFQALLARAFNG